MITHFIVSHWATPVTEDPVIPLRGPDTVNGWLIISLLEEDRHGRIGPVKEQPMS